MKDLKICHIHNIISKPSLLTAPFCRIELSIKNVISIELSIVYIFETSKVCNSELESHFYQCPLNFILKL